MIALYWLVLWSTSTGMAVMPEKYTWSDCVHAGNIATSEEWNGHLTFGAGQARIGRFTCVPVGEVGR